MLSTYKLVLILNGQSCRREGGCNIHLLHLFRDVSERFLPLVCEGTNRSVLRNDSNLFLSSHKLESEVPAITATYPCSFDDIQALLPVFRVLIRILAPDKDLDLHLTTLERLEMLGCA